MNSTGTLDGFDLCANLTALTVHSVLDTMQALLILVSVIFSLVLNIIVGYLVYNSSCYRLPFPVRVAALNIVVIGLFYIVSVIPSMFVSAVTMKRTVAITGCEFFGVMHDGLTALRILLSTVICTDRLFLSLAPDVYNHGISFSLTVVLWGIYFVYVVVATKFHGCFSYEPALKTCTAYGGCSECEVSNWIFFGVFLVSGILLPAISFPIVFCKCKKSVESRPQPVVSWPVERQATTECQQVRVEENEELQREQQEQQLLRQQDQPVDEELQQELLRQLQPEEEHEYSVQQPVDEEPIQAADEEEPTDAEEEEPIVAEDAEQVVTDNARKTNKVMMLLLLSVVLFHTMSFLLGFLQQRAILAPSSAIYAFQVLVSTPLTYMAPIFDCLVVVYYYHQKISVGGARPITPLGRLRNRGYCTPVLSRFPSPLSLPPPPPPHCDEATPSASGDPPADQPRAGSPIVHVEFRRRHSLPYMPTLSPIKERVSFRVSFKLKMRSRETEV